MSTQNERDIQANMERGLAQFKELKRMTDQMFGPGSHDKLMKKMREPQSLDSFLGKFPKKTWQKSKS